MNDQAFILRDKMAQKQKDTNQVGMRIMTVTSGKGGVGKSNFSTNLSICMKRGGRKPLVLDADFGLSNVEVILGERPSYHLGHYLEGKCNMDELLCQTRYGVPFISGGSGVKEMLFLDRSQVQRIAEGLSSLEGCADTLIIDTGAGINEIVVKFCEIADELLIVVTPEPASITDAYALIKTLVKRLEVKPVFRVMINKVESLREAQMVYDKLSYVAQQFLAQKLEFGGYIPYDSKLFEAVKRQQPIVAYDPRAKSSQAYHRISHELFDSQQASGSGRGMNWLDKFKQAFCRE